MNPHDPAARAGLARWLDRPWFLSFWCLLAAFGAYASMYGFRKPFTAGSYLDLTTGLSFKSWLVSAQVLGYAISKFIGIRVIAEMPPTRRGITLLGLVSFAEIALVLFAWTPPPWNSVWLFLNGLPLGMVFGLVLGFLEGRRLSELFVAGLCASFILADGVTKSVGAWLLASGIPEPWMPSVAGAVFMGPLVVFVWMLQRIPAPSSEDQVARSERRPMTREDRWNLVRTHGGALGLICAAYLLITILRSLRADFAPEIWKALGNGSAPGLYTQSEIWVALGVLLANGSVVLIHDNRRAWNAAIRLCILGSILAIAAVAALRSQVVGGFGYMVLLGLGLYLPYVAVHTTLFERLLAISRLRGNIGFLMYLADTAGYAGYVGVMLGKQWWNRDPSFLQTLDWIILVSATLCLIAFIAAKFLFFSAASKDLISAQPETHPGTA